MCSTCHKLIVIFAISSTTCFAQSESGRVNWDACRIVGSPEPPAMLSIERVYPELELQKPTEMVRLPGTDRWVITQVNGKILSFSKSDASEVHVAIDLKKQTPTWRQTFGIAFHPKFPSEPWCYITGSVGPRHPSEGARISRFRVTDVNKLTIDPGSETILARWSSNDHMGGSPKFGPDGYLYFSVGDGQRPNPPDPSGTGQDISDLQASVCRIDIDQTSGELPYRIPNDNPFVNVPNARGEVWAFGLRNPWRISFHPTRGDLWVGDVGWEMMEMVHKIHRGANYGWSVLEGSQMVKPNGVRHPVPVTPPIAEYDHTQGRSISGGCFWTSDRIPELVDTYIYGDYQSGKIWGVKHDGAKTIWNKELANTRARIICFAEDDDGEVLLVDFTGSVWKFNRNAAASKQGDQEFPRLLSQTGLFKSVKGQTPEPGVVAYSINAKHWADHTTSEQWFGIPTDDKMGINKRSFYDDGTMKGYFSFPEGMVFAKTVSYRTDVNDPKSERRLETQILHKLDQDWRAYNYIWNDDQTDAKLQPNEAKYSKLTIKDPAEPNGIRTQKWLHASRDQCMLCHIWRAGSINGFKVDQLNRVHKTGSLNQLDWLEQADYVNVKLARPEPAVSPLDKTADLNRRARRYLDLNCTHCHMRGGGGTANIVLLHTASEDELELFGQPPVQGTFGIPNAKIVERGQPSRSVLLYRLAKSGPGQMPKFGNHVTDQAGIELIRDWIESMKPNTDEAIKQVDRLTTNTKASGGRKPSGANDTNPNEIKSLLTTTNTALALAIMCGELPPTHPLRIVAVEQSRTAKPEVRDLFERFLPESERTQRLGPDITVKQLLAMRGNADRGRKLFHEASSLSCRTCHQIKGQGRMVGPNLDDVAKRRSREQIVRSLLNPSAEIEDKFRSHLVITTEGKIVSGFKTAETDDAVTIIDAEGKQHTIATEDIDEIEPQSKSLMPDGLMAPLPPQQAADLLAFLFDLRG